MLAGPELWLIDLSAAAAALLEIEAHTPRLSEDDIVKCSGPQAARAGRRAAHIALRILIERAFGAAWRGQPYRISADGKLSLAGATGAFSLAHSGGLALVGVVTDGPIGVDIERRREVTMSADRRRQIEAAAAVLAPEPLAAEPEARFLQAWVRLEAVAKAEGRGIGPLLTALGVTASGARSPAAVIASPYAALGVSDLALGAGIFGAAALVRGLPAPPVLQFPAARDQIASLTQ